MKMLCSKATADEEETLVRLFYNTSCSCQLLLLFLYCSSILLAKFFHYVGSFSILQRNQYEYCSFSDEEEEEEEEEQDYYNNVEYSHTNDLVADIIQGGESLVFLQEYYNPLHNEQVLCEENTQSFESAIEEPDYDDNNSAEELMTSESQSEHDVQHIVEEDVEIAETDTDSVHDSDQIQDRPTSPIAMDMPKSDFILEDDKICDESNDNLQDMESKKIESDFQRDNFVVFGPSKLETGKFIVEEKDDEEIFGDSYTIGSTSKDSSEWRSSINCRDSVTTEDPFSSSSRRSCPKWESYTVFQKYDEEMIYFDRISAQKLHETESLKSFEVCPRSISDRIVHKFTTINKTPSNIRRNPYHELEAAYVAQICLTWEALNWNYKNFHRKKSLHRDFDIGCPAHIAQQFQQFQVLLQRYIENEPYEQGRRPEIYARMRLLAPKLLLVPEYRDSEDDQKDEGFKSRVSSAAFLMIMEDGIRTFMNFLKADKERPCQVITSFFKRHKRGSVDPSLLQLIKKVNTKKKTKVKDLRRSHKCLRKRKLKVEEEMEILMALIDLKIVSRVLRMSDLSEEQLHWCEEKMSKVRISEGKLQRDSSPLFFPAH